VGLAVSLTLFVAFQTLGSPTDDESLAITVALAGRSLVLAREAGLLIALPLSLAAFAAGWLADRRVGRSH
jgi:hypothetical protein